MRLGVKQRQERREMVSDEVRFVVCAAELSAKVALRRTSSSGSLRREEVDKNGSEELVVGSRGFGGEVNRTAARTVARVETEGGGDALAAEGGIWSAR